MRYSNDRVIVEAHWYENFYPNMRGLAQAMDMPLSTVHYHLAKRLKDISPIRYNQIKNLRDLRNIHKSRELNAIQKENCGRYKV